MKRKYLLIFMRHVRLYFICIIIKWYQKQTRYLIQKKKNYWSPQSGNYKLIWFFFLKSLLLEPPSTVIIRIRYQPFYFAFPIVECRRPTFVYIYNTLNQDNDKWHAFFVVVFSFRNNKYLKCSSGRQSKYAKRCWIYPKN